MSKFCDKCEARDVGCELIQKMNADIRKFRRKKDCFWKFSYFVIVIMGIAIVILCGLSLFVHTKEVIYTPAINCKITNVSSKTKEAQTPQELYLVAERAKCEISTAVQNTFLQFGEKISAEYEKKFATILALLTILGIVFPTIIAFIQHQFSERELDKIDEGMKKSEDAIKKAQDAFKKAQDALKNVTLSMDQLKEQKKSMFCSFGLIYYDLATKTKNNQDSTNLFLIMSIYFYLMEVHEDITRFNSSKFSALSQIKINSDQKENNVSMNFLLELDKCIRIAVEIYQETKDGEIEEILKELCGIKEQWEKQKTKVTVGKMTKSDENIEQKL